MTTYAPVGQSPTRTSPLPSGAGSSRLWRIHQIADDFDLTGRTLGRRWETARGVAR